MDRPELPLTRAGVRAWAVAAAARRGVEPGEVTPVTHEGFEDDQVAGGFAFRAGRVVLVATRDGAHGSHLDPGDHAARVALVEKVWERGRRRHRRIRPDELGPAHRAALTALEHGVRRVAALPPGRRPGVGPAGLVGAEWLLMTLRHSHPRRSPTPAEALLTLAGQDHLLEPPPPDPGVHPCPVCRGLAPWTSRYRRAVCADCAGTARCRHGRTVRGANVSISGGFAAHHRDDGSPCDETTAVGAVTLSGLPGRMGEARFGGVVVEAAQPEVAPGDELAVSAVVRDLVGLLAEVSGLRVPTPPDWAVQPVPGGSDLDDHLRRVAEHLTDAMARDWWSRYGDPADPGGADTVRVGLLRLLDPAWATA